MNPILCCAVSGISKSAQLMAASGLAFFIGNAMPDESIFKLASGVTGWALAVSCIWVLTKTVKTLFAKLEAKDDLIRTMLEKQLTDLKKELDIE